MERLFQPELRSQGSMNMIKVLPFRCQQYLARLPCYYLKGPLKWDFLDIYRTTSLEVRKLENTSATVSSFFENVQN